MNAPYFSHTFPRIFPENSDPVQVDGMSGGDRGGMAELIQLIRKTKIPIICICNDHSSPKVKSLTNYCLDLRFRKPTTKQMLPRFATIAAAEGEISRKFRVNFFERWFIYFIL